MIASLKSQLLATIIPNEGIFANLSTESGFLYTKRWTDYNFCYFKAPEHFCIPGFHVHCFWDIIKDGLIVYLQNHTSECNDSVSNIGGVSLQWHVMQTQTVSMVAFV